MKKICALSCLLLFTSSALFSQHFEKESMTGFYSSGGLNLITFEKLNSSLLELDCSEFTIPVMSYGGGMFLGNINSSLFTSCDIYLYRQARQSAAMNQTDLYGMSMQGHIFGIIHKQKSLTVTAFTGAGINSLYLLLRTPNNNTGMDPAKFNAVPQQVSQNMSGMLNMGLSFDRVFGLYGRTITQNKLLVSARICVSVPVASGFATRTLFIPEIAIEKPFVGITVVIGRVKYRNKRILADPDQPADQGSPSIVY
ncbi:MAG: hypothetical protein KKA07_00605 [Bacteroidetes bacterium]|nr:hypothetical protein [Bacteroidota bacterium]MBU1717551.1 hypothetical protein [Bacteroidota bacterium]